MEVEWESGWWDDAKCKGEDTDIFYLTDVRTERSLRVFCSTCPVVEQCRDDATDPRSPVPTHGIRAGLTPRQQQYMRSRRQRKK